MYWAPFALHQQISGHRRKYSNLHLVSASFPHRSNDTAAAPIGNARLSQSGRKYGRNLQTAKTSLCRTDAADIFDYPTQGRCLKLMIQAVSSSEEFIPSQYSVTVVAPEAYMLPHEG